MADMHLLLVDDEERFLTTTKTLLEKRGITTFTALNGVNATKIIDDHSIDVVILDVKMPGVDGVEVLRKTRQRHPLVEVIMLTGHASVESAVEGLKLGAFDYVTKPCEISELVNKLNEAYAKKQATEEKVRKAKRGKTVRHPTAVFQRNEEE